jgi:hypothetical protein
MPGTGVRLVVRQDCATGRLRVGEPPLGLFRVGAFEQPLERRGRGVGPLLGQILSLHASMLQ